MAYARSGMEDSPRPLIFVADSLRVLRTFPEKVRQHVGHALREAQNGKKHLDAEPLKDFGGGVLEIVSDHRGDTFRTVYTVRFESAVYVLHVFQKKSKSGIATPKAVIELIKQRLRVAKQIEEERQGQQ